MLIRLTLFCVCFQLIRCQGYNIAGFFEENDNEANAKAFEVAIATANTNRKEEYALSMFNVIIPSQNPFVAMNTTCTLTKQSIIGVFGPSSLSNIHAVQAVCDAKEIPHILTKWMNGPPKLGTALNFYPNPSLLTRAYIDFIQEWKWKTFTCLYEDDESLLRLSGLILFAKENSIVATVEQLDRENSGNFRDALKKIRKTNQKFLIIDCSNDNLIEVLVQCQQVGLMTQDYHYFLTNLDAHTKDLSPFQWSQANITGIRLVNPDSAYVQEISQTIFEPEDELEDPSVTTSRLEIETALTYDAVHMFSDILSKMEEYHPPYGASLDCYQPDSWELGYSVVNLLKTSSHRGLTGPIEFDNQGSRSAFNLQMYEIRESGITTVASWNSSEGLNITKKHSEAEDLGKDSMRNKTFTVLITLTDPYGMNKEASEQLVGNDRYEGFSIDLIEELAKLEGFNYTFVVQADGKNGNKENGRWTGMIGEVVEGRADMAITDLTITSDRAEAVDFTSPFMNLGVSILFQKPSKAPPNFFSFAQPFALDTWIALAVAFLIVSLSFFLLGRICPDEWTNPYPCVEEPEYLINQFSLANAVWFATGAMLQQGSEIAPIAIPTRLVSGVWWFFVLIMVSSYTANLASFLVSESHVELFTDVKSLLEKADKHNIRYGAKAKGATLDFFEKSTGNELHQEIARHMREHPEDMPGDNKVGVQMAEEMKYAFFMESTTIEYTIQRHCSLTIVGDRLDEKGYGIALKKDSPYRTRLSLAILKLQTSGEIEKIRKKWWEERKGGGQCTGAENDPTATPLDLENVEGIFYVTIFGTILGIVLVIFEFIVNIFRICRKLHISFREGLKREIIFFFKFNSNVKPVLDNRSEEEEEKSEPRSESNRSKSKSEKSKSVRSHAESEVRPYGFVISSPSLDRLTE
ncbi:glutamate receptor ionotropic, kainate 2-like [Sitophilus oryzae]|uniref:Glutamate receptor ionotropic, kainate 2-like n=1 Tax=Sitophilus oryzae TaxID=7048 RepID=A0A6J2XFQ3_SITOR|nr:glutamate receptor ionotropic, kainate 2-like [Sitophilus oryzae]